LELLPYFEWIEASLLGNTVRQSLWLFPVIQSFHLLGLSVLGGSVLIVDLRMMGLGLRGHAIATVAREARPWFVLALLVTLVTGVGLFASEAIKCYYNTSFWVKITTLPVAIAVTLLVRDRLARGAGLAATTATRVVGLSSLGLWLLVAAAGRWIGFS
jgi:hypothetical protein